jgi:hypothetical protein
MKKVIILLALSGFFITCLAKQDTTIEKRSYLISEITGQPPVIDGNFSDETWQSAEWQGEFVQHYPYGGRNPAFDTRFAIAHDEDYIYVAIKAFDPEPDSIVSRLTRRDDIDGDFVLVDLDSYHDMRTCFAFLVSAGGIRADYIISNNGQNEDETWDAIWWAKTLITSDGWNAEMKIPFSQLRFDNSQAGAWGLEVGRKIFRKDELSFWQHIPQDAPGIVHLFGELSGMRGIKPRKQAEVVPYISGGIKTYQADAENPFLSGKDPLINVGMDAKLGITNNLTLDLSINPDFGQVEADPSEVNLTAYESFFEEKRPLFIEGKNIYNFPLRFGGSPENLFYSRRIGRSPHYCAPLEQGEYLKQPEQTNILAAAKLSGKTRGGTSIGFLESVAAEEVAFIANGDERREVIAEPMTNYFVGRVVQDINKGNTIIGGAVTSTYRHITEEYLDFLPVSATTGGIDFQQFWSNRGYYVKMMNYGSHIQGSPEAITRLQKCPSHLFQRPDADYLELDTTTTHLSGFGGNLEFVKTSGRFNTIQAVTWKSPGLELNDLGYFRMGDEILMVNWFGYNWYEPFSVFRRLHISGDYFQAWDFGGYKAVNGIELQVITQFSNFWSATMYSSLTGEARYNSLLRGGPSIKTPGRLNARLFLESDERKKLVFEPSLSLDTEFENSEMTYNMAMEVDYRPMNFLHLSIEPNYSRSRRNLQYTNYLDVENTDRYLFASIDQLLLSLSIRLNLTLMPDLTIQYWGQPFIAAGDYNEFKYITDGLADTYSDRYHVYGPSEITLDNELGTYTVNEKSSGLPEYSFDDPDFIVKEFLSNLVIRYEYRPGSVMYLVWSQTREGHDPGGSFDFGQDLSGIWKIQPTNIFLVKFSYRIGR